LLAHAIRPHLEWRNPRFIQTPGLGESSPKQLSVRLKNHARRDAIDVEIFAELRVDHEMSIDGVTRTVIRLPLNSSWMPRIRNEAVIRVENEKIDGEQWERLKSRIGKSYSTLGQVLDEYKNSTIRLYALAYDRFSGARRIFIAEYGSTQAPKSNGRRLKVL